MVSYIYTELVAALLCCCTYAHPLPNEASVDISTTGNITSSPESSPVSNSTPLSAGSAFVLVTSLVAALVFHPFNGSLVYGPSLRYWIVAPTSVLVELALISRHVSRHCVEKLAAYHEDIQDRDSCSIRNKMYYLVAARSINIYGGHRRRLLHSTQPDIADHIRQYVAAINEGWRFRALVALPIVPQYVKLMAASGSSTIFLKVLGSLYVLHWIVLELICLVAQEGDGFETVSRVRELLPTKQLSDQRVPDVLNKALLETGESTTIFESKSYLVHQSAAVIGACLMLLCWPSHVVPIMFAVVVPWIWILKCMLQHDRRAKAVARRTVDLIEWRSIRDMIPFGGPGIGADAGCIYFVFWILYCVYIYNGEGTTRPSWPWLDWFG